MDKKDQEEIEKWKKQKLNYVETYGVDIFAKRKDTTIFRRLINLSYRITKGILIIIAIAIVVGTFSMLWANWKACYAKVHIDPVETISQMYGKKVKVKYKELDENRNGKYILTIKQNKDIYFNAIVEWTMMKNDYSDRCQKYYYEKWEDDNKEKIITEEKYENNLLIYNQFININGENEIEDAIKLMYKFVEYAGDFYYPDWNIYLQTDKGKIYPFNNRNINIENTITNTKNMYHEMQNKDINKEINDGTDYIKEFFSIPIT